MDILLQWRSPPSVRSLPPVENGSLFRAEQSEVEEELRAVLGLAEPEDPEHMVSARSPPQGAMRGLDNTTQETEPASSPRLVPNAAPSIVDPPNPPGAPSDPTQVDQVEVPLPLPCPQIKNQPKLTFVVESGVFHGQV